LLAVGGSHVADAATTTCTVVLMLSNISNVKIGWTVSHIKASVHPSQKVAAFLPFLTSRSWRVEAGLQRGSSRFRRFRRVDVILDHIALAAIIECRCRRRRR
jgi:hypothetical protein